VGIIDVVPSMAHKKTKVFPIVLVVHCSCETQMAFVKCFQHGKL